ncbi:MAG: hypothetical protein R2828_00135 [Saprospiraceae bacterium]
MKQLPFLNKSIGFLALISLVLASCTSPMKLVESGDFDQAIELSVKKLAGKKTKKTKYVMALEEAFEKITSRDMALAENLKEEGRPENWEKINDIYRKIKRRQDKISPLLPLIDKEGIKADFRFVKVDGLERESRDKAAAFLYEDARNSLAQAKEGNKMAARNAYRQLEKIGQYYTNYKDRTQLMELAQELGTSYILFEMVNNAPVVLPIGFERELTRISINDLNDRWKEYHTRQQTGVDYDFKVVMNMTAILVSPGLVQEREYVDSKEIEDGFDYVLDENGNVKKDTAGNDIKIPRRVIIRSKVFETYQNKVANVSGRLEYIDLNHNQVIHTDHIAVEAVFENYAATFSGDERALSKESRRRIGNRPLPFPENEDLLFTAAEQLKPLIKEKISKSSILI